MNEISIGKRLEKTPFIKTNENLPSTFIGSYQFSEISYSKDKKTASIIMVSNNGMNCSVGILITLKKESNSWKFIKEKMLWIT